MNGENKETRDHRKRFFLKKREDVLSSRGLTRRGRRSGAAPAVESDGDCAGKDNVGTRPNAEPSAKINDLGDQVDATNTVGANEVSGQSPCLKSSGNGAKPGKIDKIVSPANIAPASIANAGCTSGARTNNETNLGPGTKHPTMRAPVETIGSARGQATVSGNSDGSDAGLAVNVSSPALNRKRGVNWQSVNAIKKNELQLLPRFHDGLSYLYVEHCKIEQDMSSIKVMDKDGVVPVPAASLALLMIGPGTSISHAAIKNLAECGCLIAWCGEQGTRLYAAGMGKTRSSKNLLKQAELWANPATRVEVARRMYAMRFEEKVDGSTTMEQLRGMEGARIRRAYQEAAKQAGIVWTGRKYDRNSWGAADAVNRALSVANTCLYGLCHAAIVTAGYSPAIGFIHTGNLLSFVYDIADLYKVEITIPLAFSIAGENSRNISSRTRVACRDAFKSRRLIERILPDIEHVLDVSPSALVEKDGPGDQDGRVGWQGISDEEEDFFSAYPGGLWDPEKGIIDGGVNYEESNEQGDD